MAYLESSSFAWVFGIVQVVGLASAWMARLSEGSANQSSCHRLFFGLLGAIGLMTMLSVTLGPRYLLVACFTIAAMVLVAVWDLRAHAPAGGL
jgi:hypothetical protein